jgi:hypothetical protein
MEKELKVIARCDAVLLNLSFAKQEEIWEWCHTPSKRDEKGHPIANTGGKGFAKDCLAKEGIKISRSALSRFCTSFAVKQDMLTALHLEKDYGESHPGEAKAARLLGESIFLKLSIARQNAQVFSVATRAVDHRQALELKAGEHSLRRQKFMRDTCRLFLQWSEDPRAKEILNSPTSHAEKIEALGRGMFGEDWDE